MPPPSPLNGSSAGTHAFRNGVFCASMLLAVGTLVRVFYFVDVAGGSFTAVIFPDESNYYLPAAQMIRAQGLGFFLEPRSLWNAPLNPLWIAAFGGNVAAVKLANLALSVGAGYLIWDMGRRSFGGRAGLIAAGLYALHVPFLRFTATTLTEPLFVPCLILFLWLVNIAAVNPVRYHLLICAGVVLGLATLVRPTTQLLPFFLLGLLFVLRLAGRTLPKFGAHRSLLARPSVAILAGFLVVVFPYVAKNVVVLGRFGVANGTGAVLYLGNDLRTHGDEPLYSRMQFDTGRVTHPFTHLDTEGDRRLTRVALERIRAHPLDTALLLPRKAFRLLFGNADHYFWPQSNAIDFVRSSRGIHLLNVWDLALTAFLVVFGLMGMSILPMPPLVRMVFGGSVLYFAVLHTLLFPIPRMALPIAPIFIFFAAGVFERPRPFPILAGSLSALAIAVTIALHRIWWPGIGVSERYLEYFDEVLASTTGPPDYVHDLAVTTNGFESAGLDPFAVYDVDDFIANLNDIVFIELIAEGSIGESRLLTAQLFWLTDDGAFSEAQSVAFPIKMGATQRIYAVSPSLGAAWHGKVDMVRIDLPGTILGGQYRIISLEVRQ